MDKYLVEPLARWIVHSTGWSKTASIRWARTVVVGVVVVVAAFSFLVINGGSL